MFAKRRLNARFLTTVVILMMLIVTPALAAPLPSSWSPATSLESIPGSSTEVNTAFLDGCPFLSRDGLQLYIASNRPGGLGNLDIWVAERSTPDDGFGTPVNLGAPINTQFQEQTPTITDDGTILLFSSNRTGNFDLYMATRTIRPEP